MIIFFCVHLFASTLLYLDLNDEAYEEETCENCNLTKPKTSILIHIDETRACKVHYGQRFEAMKAQNKRERNQKLRARKGKEKVNEQQRQVIISLPNIFLTTL